ncbi:hypothetical protein AB205_0062390 [Aquarana catesbeiana]|uniref:EGF-like domain-containing protein n=1 Tax=Aquarana catesbeiana TaxID=8400 RepID=A0A2G9S9W8_AQUCT|nr:hypothetical protein AB205_0062390 [Aquarana catesbeiana]
MMCLDHRCLPIDPFNFSSCMGSTNKICSGNGICSSEVKCICDKYYIGEDCSTFFPYKSTSKPDVIDDGQYAHSKSLLQGTSLFSSLTLQEFNFSSSF